MTDHQFELLIYELRLLREALSQSVNQHGIPAWDPGSDQCFVCGMYHNGLPCPKMTPMAASSEERTMKVNKHGCKPTEDVCMEHHQPLECRHGCIEAQPHRCSENGWTSIEVAKRTGQQIITRGKRRRYRGSQ